MLALDSQPLVVVDKCVISVLAKASLKMCVLRPNVLCCLETLVLQLIERHHIPRCSDYDQFVFRGHAAVEKIRTEGEVLVLRERFHLLKSAAVDVFDELALGAEHHLADVDVGDYLPALYYLGTFRSETFVEPFLYAGALFLSLARDGFGLRFRFGKDLVRFFVI